MGTRTQAWIQISIYGIVAAFLGRALVTGWPQVREFAWRGSLFSLVVVALCLLLFFFVQGMLWSWTVRRAGIDLRYSKGIRIYVSALLTRYMPGGIWPFAQMSLTAHQMEESPVVYTYLFSINLVFAALAAAVVGLPLVPLLLADSLRWATLLAVLLAVALLVAGPRLLTVLSRVLKRMGYQTTLFPELTDLPSLPLARIFLVSLVGQLLAGLAFTAFVGSQIDLSGTDIPYLVSCWCASWLSGFLVFPVPMGLGVREAVLTSLLSSMMPGSVAVLLAFGYRLFTALIDLLIMLAFGVTSARFSRQN